MVAVRQMFKMLGLIIILSKLASIEAGTHCNLFLRPGHRADLTVILADAPHWWYGLVSKWNSWTTAFRRPWCFVGVGWGVGGGVGWGMY